KRSPFWIDGLKPIQLATFDLDEYRECRRQFTTDEWVDLLVRSVGLEPSHLDRRLKLLFLIRLLPLCEANYNLVELGPRGTGKSYAYQVIDRIHYYVPGWELPKMRVEFFTDHYGFVVDYLAEALRELRKHNFTEVIDRHYSFGAHLNARDVKAVRKSVS